jgi:hypothetical protein
VRIGADEDVLPANTVEHDEHDRCVFLGRRHRVHR